MKLLIKFILVINSVFADLVIRGSLYYDRRIESLEILRGPPLRCVITGSRPKPSVTWLIGSRRLNENEYSTRTKKSDPFTTISELKIKLSEADKLEIIGCFAQNPSFPGEIRSDRIDLVATDDDLERKVTDIQLLEGSTLCYAFGSKPEPQIVWYMDDYAIPKDKYKYTFNKDTLIANSFLNMNFSEYGREVQLLCAARNPKHPDDWISASITVKTNDILRKSEDLKVRILKDPLRCEAHVAYPGTILSLGINGRDFPVDETKPNAYSYDEDTNTAIAFYDTSFLSVKDKTAELSCKASWDGYDYTHAKITIPLPDPTAVQLRARILRNPLRCEAQVAYPDTIIRLYMSGRLLPKNEPILNTYVEDTNTLIAYYDTSLLAKNGSAYLYCEVAWRDGGEVYTDSENIMLPDPTAFDLEVRILKNPLRCEAHVVYPDTRIILYINDRQYENEHNPYNKDTSTAISYYNKSAFGNDKTAEVRCEAAPRNTYDFSIARETIALDQEIDDFTVQILRNPPRCEAHPVNRDSEVLLFVNHEFVKEYHYSDQDNGIAILDYDTSSLGTSGTVEIECRGKPRPGDNYIIDKIDITLPDRSPDFTVKILKKPLRCEAHPAQRSTFMLMLVDGSASVHHHNKDSGTSIGYFDISNVARGKTVNLICKASLKREAPAFTDEVDITLPGRKSADLKVKILKNPLRCEVHPTDMNIIIDLFINGQILSIDQLRPRTYYQDTQTIITFFNTSLIPGATGTVKLSCGAAYIEDPNLTMDVTDIKLYERDNFGIKILTDPLRCEVQPSYADTIINLLINDKLLPMDKDKPNTYIQDTYTTIAYYNTLFFGINGTAKLRCEAAWGGGTHDFDTKSITIHKRKMEDLKVRILRDPLRCEAQPAYPDTYIELAINRKVLSIADYKPNTYNKDTDTIVAYYDSSLINGTALLYCGSAWRYDLPLAIATENITLFAQSTEDDSVPPSNPSSTNNGLFKFLKDLRGIRTFYSTNSEDVCKKEEEEEKEEKDENRVEEKNSVSSTGGGGIGIPFPIVPFFAFIFAIPALLFGFIGGSDKDSENYRYDLEPVMKNIDQLFVSMSNTSNEYLQYLENTIEFRTRFINENNKSVSDTSLFALTLIGNPQEDYMKELNSNMQLKIKEFGKELFSLLHTTASFKTLSSNFQTAVNNLQSKMTEFQNSIKKLTFNKRTITYEYVSLTDYIQDIADTYRYGIEDCLNDGLSQYAILFEDVNRKIKNGVDYMHPLFDRINPNKNDRDVWKKEIHDLEILTTRVEALKDNTKRLLDPTYNGISCCIKLRDALAKKISRISPLIPTILYD